MGKATVSISLKSELHRKKNAGHLMGIRASSGQEGPLIKETQREGN